ncbi:MAG: helix-turn-helix domain-containing protein [Planctomycetota bacterium]|nr:helix-turn-helix domain-containing protein [Planctomycetota bacterium]
MPRRKAPDPKVQALREGGSLNPHPEQVQDELFQRDRFFDARDRVQVKYEMLRRVRVDGQPIRRVASDFGFSRPTYYQAQLAFEEGGLAALVPKKPGPRGGHKLDEEVLEFLAQRLQEEPDLRLAELVPLVQARFGRSVHPRSIERALKRRGKKKP